MNFDARLPQFAPYKLQPSVIRDICIGQSQGLDLVGSEDDRIAFRKAVAYQLDAYRRSAVRYAAGVMGVSYTKKRPFAYICEAVANGWICQAMSEAAV